MSEKAAKLQVVKNRRSVVTAFTAAAGFMRGIATLNQSGDWNVREFMVGADVSNRKHQWVLAVQNSPDVSDASTEFLTL